MNCKKMLERDLLQAYCARVWEKYALIVAGSRNFHDCFLAFNLRPHSVWFCGKHGGRAQFRFSSNSNGSISILGGFLFY